MLFRLLVRRYWHGRLAFPELTIEYLNIIPTRLMVCPYFSGIVCVLLAPFLFGRGPAPTHAHPHQRAAVRVPVVQAPVHAQAQHGPAHSQETRRRARPLQRPRAPAAVPELQPSGGRGALRPFGRVRGGCGRRGRGPDRHAARHTRQHGHRSSVADQVARGRGQNVGHQKQRLRRVPPACPCSFLLVTVARPCSSTTARENSVHKQRVFAPSVLYIRVRVILVLSRRVFMYDIRRHVVDRDETMLYSNNISTSNGTGPVVKGARFVKMRVCRSMRECIIIN